ncbi:MAG TPA: ATP-binding protein [Dokdonella sp.]|nr:ATP-binding protein [Dokdonella sp.]
MPGNDRPPLPDWDTLYENAACGLLLTGPNGMIRHVNRTFCDWLGVERDALVGRRRFQDLLTVGCRIFHQTHWAPLLQMQGSIAEVKLDFLHADGKAIPIVANAVAREHAGTVFHEIALFIARDRDTYERELMSARKQAEVLLAQQSQARADIALANARLHLALEAAHLHVWDVDPQTLERRLAPSAALLLGYDKPCPIEAAELRDAIDPADRDQALTEFRQQLTSSTGISQYVFRLNGIDGVQRTIRATARALFEGEDGKTRHVVGLLQDITELSQQRAAAEDRALFAEQMIGIVSHDLRNPLATIMLGAECLRSSDLPEDDRRILHNIDRSVGRANRMIADLLDFTAARIGRGLGVTIRPLDLHALVAADVEELSVAYVGQKIIHQRTGKGKCKGDADRLSQLIGNLVSNAVAYGDGAPITVASDIEGERFQISVSNGGSPIPPHVLPELFKPMVRGTSKNSGKRSVGLGLYIVSEIVQAHGGSIEVTSSASEGTRFTATFPLERRTRAARKVAARGGANRPG